MTSLGMKLKSSAIYPASRLNWVTLFLYICKLLKAIALFLGYSVLKHLNFMYFLFMTKFVASLFFLVLQKPFSTGRRLSRNQWIRVIQYSIIECFICLLWIYGFTLCGTVRTILLYEHSDIVVVGLISIIFGSNSPSMSKIPPAKYRGALFFLISILSLLFFDLDDPQLTEHLKNYPDGRHHHHFNFITHIIGHLFSYFGLSDHKLGVVLLVFLLFIRVGFSIQSRRLAVELGGIKRLHSFTTFITSIILSVVCAWMYFTDYTFTYHDSNSSLSGICFSVITFAIIVFLLNFYAESAVLQKSPRDAGPNVGLAGTFMIFVAALILSITFFNDGFFYNEKRPLTYRYDELHTSPDENSYSYSEHPISGGVVFSLVLFLFADYNILFGQSGTFEYGRGLTGSYKLVGETQSGLPVLASQTTDPFYAWSSTATFSITSGLKSGLKQILADGDSRKIFYFLCLNLIFTFVEMIYGVLTNSLGLISDSFHMLFDCSALVMGLYASVMSHWKPTKIFSFGFETAEVLSGFINGLFLVVISFFIFVTALDRIFDPPEINTNRLLTVSVLGLVVNLFGVFVFHGSLHGHSHSGSNVHSHSHSHNSGNLLPSVHSDLTSKSIKAPSNVNMTGVYLHVLADTLGSVGVIVSSILVQFWGWNIADPICSLFISILIFTSVLPLLTETISILALRSPDHIHDNIGLALAKVEQLSGVISYREPHFWRHSSTTVCGSIHILVAPDTSEQGLIPQLIAIFKEHGISQITLQLEKESFFTHLRGISSNKSWQEVVDVVQTSEKMKFGKPIKKDQSKLVIT